MTDILMKQDGITENLKMLNNKSELLEQKTEQNTASIAEPHLSVSLLSDIVQNQILVRLTKLEKMRNGK